MPPSTILPTAHVPAPDGNGIVAAAPALDGTGVIAVPDAPATSPDPQEARKAAFVEVAMRDGEAIVLEVRFSETVEQLQTAMVQRIAQERTIPTPPGHDPSLPPLYGTVKIASRKLSSPELPPRVPTSD